MTEESDSRPPLLSALPPATDYMTYLTILDVNLTKVQLPLLHDILQDTQLTINIGWDLVHILIPLLPESEQCLNDVACLGNPREVVLKVTELIEELSVQVVAADEDFGDATEDEEHETDPDTESSNQTQIHERFCQLFQTLVHMLCILHPRIKTQYPSRFLLTSLQAVLPAYASLARFPPATRSILMLLKTLSGSKRPHLPPRGTTEESIPMVKTATAAADPEGSGVPVETEAETQKRLLSALITHIAKQCLENFPELNGGSGLAWVERYGERREPEKIVPYRQGFNDLFAADEELQNRDALVGQLLNIAVGDLKISWNDLIATILPPSESAAYTTSPLSTPEFNPSRFGAIYILSAKAATALLANTLPPFSLPLFPSHALLVSTFIGDASMANIGTEPLPLIDGIITLGWSSFTAQHMTIDTSTVSAEDFNKYLQRLSLLSANHPSSSLRYQAHLYLSTILHAHPSSQVRLDFIRDTLEHCPYENLKASAVGWAKTELLTAFDEHGNRYEESGDRVPKEAEGPTSNVFTNPESLGALAELMYRAPDDGEELESNTPFYLAALNLAWLLCKSEERFKGFNMAMLLTRSGGKHVGQDVRKTKEPEVLVDFVVKLDMIVEKAKEAGDVERVKAAFGTGAPGGVGELNLLEDRIARVTEALGNL